MFYFNELFLRFKFISFSCVLILFSCYIYKNVLLTVFSFSLLNLPLNSFKDFIYTHPIELFQVHLYFSVLICVYLALPLYIWHILDFLKSSLTKYNYTSYLSQSVVIVLIFFLSNIISFYYLLPNIWFFFTEFNTSGDTSNLLNFFFELRIQEYFNFVIDFLYLTNIFISLFLFLYFLIFFFGLSNIIYWKRLFIFINIVCATLLSPPDVSSQIIILIILSLLFETLIFLSLYSLNLNINHEKLIWHHIK